MAVEQYASTICIKASNQDLSKGRPCKCAQAQSTHTASSIKGIYLVTTGNYLVTNLMIGHQIVSVTVRKGYLITTITCMDRQCTIKDFGAEAHCYSLSSLPKDLLRVEKPVDESGGETS